MRKTICFLLSFLFIYSAHAAEALALNYSIIKNPYRLTTYFEMHGKAGSEGKAIKKSLTVRTTYDLYDAKGEYVGQGICRALSLGVLYTWAKVIDIYDAKDKKIGLIDGQTLTTAKGKYNIYTKEHELVASAYLDYASSSFSLLDPNNTAKTLGLIKRNFNSKGSDSWDVSFYDSSAFDVRILKIFSAFVIDHQEYFK